MSFTDKKSASAQMLTFIQALFIQCLEFRVSFTLLCLPLRELPAGARIELKRLSQENAFTARHIKMSQKSVSMFQWKNVNKKYITDDKIQKFVDNSI